MTEIKLAGVSFGDCQENIKRFGCTDTPYYTLTREPDNRSDPNAIRVTLAYWMLGYIPKDVATVLAPKMDTGANFMAEFVRLNEYPGHDRIGITVRIVEVQ